MRIVPAPPRGENRASRGGSAHTGSPHLTGVLFTLCCGWLFTSSSPPARAQLNFPETISAHSRSGQFIVSARRFATVPAVDPNLAKDPSIVRLEPTLVTISCERIKRAIDRELQSSAPWRGKIYVTLYPAATAADGIELNETRYNDGWQYVLRLPDRLDRFRYLQAVVQVVLLETANRKAENRTAEIPRWLCDGLAAQLLAQSEKEIILTPPGAGSPLGPPATFVNAQTGSPLERAHQLLCAHTPLTFDQLSWPTAEPSTPEAANIYRCSAQVFLYQLLTLPDARARLRGMVEGLSQYYNWQFAFIEAFRPCFQQTLNVEKWWAIQALHFTGHDLTQTWPLAESWTRLDQTLHSPVEVRTGTNEMPLRTETTLQTMIRDWQDARQTDALRATLRELEVLRIHLAPALTPLLDDYHQTLATFLQDRDRGALALLFRKQTTRRKATKEALQRLDALDARRQAQRPLAEAKPDLSDTR